MNHLDKIAMIRRWEALHDASDIALCELQHVFSEDSVSFWTARYDSALNRRGAVLASADALIGMQAIEVFVERQTAARSQ